MAFVINFSTMLLLGVLTCVADVIITTALKYCDTSNHHSDNSSVIEEKMNYIINSDYGTVKVRAGSEMIQPYTLIIIKLTSS